MWTARPLSATLLACVAAMAADPQYRNTPANTVNFTYANLAQIAAARFFVSSDGGRTWTLGKEIPLNAQSERPAWEFNAPGDGTYLVATRAVYKPETGFRPEADPKNGEADPNALMLVVDTTAPVLATATATFVSAADGHLTAAVTWALTEANPGAEPVAIEVSGDDGKTFTPARTGAASGTAQVEIALDAGMQKAAVRLTAKDLAGNTTRSDRLEVAVPIPPDPVAELKRAIGALPTPTELGVQATDPTPVAPVAQVATTKPDTPATTAPAVGSELIPQQRPEILAPAGAGDPTAVSAPQPDQVTGGTVEGAYSAKLDQDRRLDTVPEKGAPNVAGAVPEDAAPLASGARAITPSADTPFIDGDEAARLLETARSLAVQGHRDEALSLFLRLHESDQAHAAIADEMRILRALGDDRTIAGIALALTPELLIDTARVEGGHSLLNLGRADDAARLLARVPRGSARAREASLYLARAWAASGQLGPATRLFEKLSAGDDEIARAAKQEMGK